MARKSSTTVTVTIYYKNGRVEVLRNIPESSAYAHEQRAFTDDTVARVDVRY